LKEPLAACLNGVKGEVVTLDRKRGREDCLHSSLVKARIDRGTLEAMLAAIDDALPMFRRYFQAKARILGFEKLPWWSLFAPIGEVNKEYSFDEARELILEHFGSFSPELAEFARGAFEKHWIDAEQRPGKRGGAFCMGVDAVQESRIMSNFDGSFDQVITLAHELGHGFHNYCAYKAGKTPMQTNTPMTLAETASIMSETIVFNALLKTVSDPHEGRAILETTISSDAQTIVDIYSRFIFEKAVFERRKESTISADEIKRSDAGRPAKNLRRWTEPGRFEQVCLDLETALLQYAVVFLQLPLRLRQFVCKRTLQRLSRAGRGFCGGL